MAAAKKGLVAQVEELREEKKESPWKVWRQEAEGLAEEEATQQEWHIYKTISELVFQYGLARNEGLSQSQAWQQAKRGGKKTV